MFIHEIFVSPTEKILATGLTVAKVTAINWVKFSSFGRRKTKNNMYTMFSISLCPALQPQRSHFLSKTCVH